MVVSPGLEFSAEVRRLTGGAGVDVAIEIVGSRTFSQTLRCMGAGGRVVVVGNVDTGSVSLNPGLLIVKELEILGAYATTSAELDEALGLLRGGKMRPYVSEGLPLAQARARPWVRSASRSPVDWCSCPTDSISTGPARHHSFDGRAPPIVEIDETPVLHRRRVHHAAHRRTDIEP